MNRGGEFRVAMLSIHSCPLGRPGTRDTGGMSIYIQNVAQGLGEQGIAVDIFTRHHGVGSPVMELAEGVRLIHLPIDGGHGKMELFTHLPDFTRAIEGFRQQAAVHYQIVHSHYWLSGGVGVSLAAWWQVPHVAMLHTSARAKNHHMGDQVDPEWRAETEKRVLESAHLVITATEAEKREIVDLYGAEAGKIAVIPCGVDLDAFRPLPRPWARRALGLDGLPVVLYVGRLVPEKGIEKLLQAVSLLAAERTIQVMIVGGDASDQGEVEWLRRRSREMGIAERTRFCGAVDQDELPLFYSAADVLVLPSRYETFGLVAVEALACGTPVIASRVGAMPQLVQDGENGFLLNDGSPAHLASLLGRLLRDNELQQRLGSASRDSVVGLGWGRVAARLAQKYYELVGVG